MSKLLLFGLMAVALGCNKKTPDGLPALSTNRKVMDASLARGAIGVAAPDSTIGWEFEVNKPIIVTHLGLFDFALEGLQSEHPVGIYRVSDSVLIASATIGSGTSAELIDTFRYVDISDVTLVAGETYVVAYYSERTATDFAATDPVVFSIAPVINHGPVKKWIVSPDGMAMPTEQGTTDGEIWIGPSFLYVTAKPTPAPPKGPLP